MGSDSVDRPPRSGIADVVTESRASGVFILKSRIPAKKSSTGVPLAPFDSLRSLMAGHTQDVSRLFSGQSACGRKEQRVECPE
jgi:hypothetical protein